MRIVIIALCLLVAGCAPYQPTADQGTLDVRSIAFVRHPNGLCFGVVRFNTYYGYVGTSITSVPTEACGR